ncbi:hypothetical protein BD560DRAFT_417006, partial [Blakeslea trispora]
SVVKFAQCLLQRKSPLDWIHLRYSRHSAGMVTTKWHFLAMTTESLGALWNISIMKMLLTEYNSYADVVNWFLLIIFICCLMESMSESLVSKRKRP